MRNIFLAATFLFSSTVFGSWGFLDPYINREIISFQTFEDRLSWGLANKNYYTTVRSAGKMGGLKERILALVIDPNNAPEPWILNLFGEMDGIFSIKSDPNARLSWSKGFHRLERLTPFIPYSQLNELLQDASHYKISFEEKAQIASSLKPLLVHQNAPQFPRTPLIELLHSIVIGPTIWKPSHTSIIYEATQILTSMSPGGEIVAARGWINLIEKDKNYEDEAFAAMIPMADVLAQVYISQEAYPALLGSAQKALKFLSQRDQTCQSVYENALRNAQAQKIVKEIDRYFDAYSRSENIEKFKNGVSILSLLKTAHAFILQQEKYGAILNEMKMYVAETIEKVLLGTNQGDVGYMGQMMKIDPQSEYKDRCIQSLLTILTQAKMYQTNYNSHLEYEYGGEPLKAAEVLFDIGFDLLPYKENIEKLKSDEYLRRGAEKLLGKI